MQRLPTDVVHAAAWTGALTAAALALLAVMIPATVSASLSAVAAKWWPVILTMSLPWVAAATILGWFAGRSVSHLNHPSVWLAALIGALFSLPAAAVLLVLALLEPGTPDTPLLPLLFVGSLGAATGAAAWRAVRLRLPATTQSMWQVSLNEMLVYMTALAVHLTVYTFT